MSLEDLTPEAQSELAALSRELAENPKTRKTFLRLTKEVRPNLPVPELEIEDRADAVLAKAQSTVTSLESKLMERDARDELASRRSNLIKKGLVKNDEEVSEVEKIMLDKKIPDHETAAEYWNFMKQAATPTPTTFSPNVFDKGTKDRFAPYWKNPAAAARESAAQILTDMRSGKIKLG